MSKWVSVWGNAMSIVNQRPEGYAKDITLRYPILMPMEGNQIRLTFDNFTGLETIKIHKITIAKSINPYSIIPTTLKTLTFDGEQECVIEAGEHKTCDPVEMKIEKNELLTVSFYLKDFTSMRCGVIKYATASKAYYSLGDQSEAVELPSEDTRETNWIYFLSQVDLYTKDEYSSIICYGDSITTLAWPEYFQFYLMHSSQNHNIGVVRKAASGSRILRQYDCLTYAAYGIKGMTRFPHEVQVSGAKSIIILHGINDIIHPVGKKINEFRPWSDLPTSKELIDGLCAYIDHARSLGLKIILGTLLPFKGWRTYSEEKEQIRSDVNEWIRTTDKIDIVIDFDQALRDENNPKMFKPIFDSGDHLHPSDLGQIQMAKEVMKTLNL